MPFECTTCPEWEHEYWGCGFDACFKGKGKFPREAPMDFDTCPQWFTSQPFVVHIWELLEDYRRGALGDVLDLPASMFAYLRVLDTELARWDSAMSEQADG